MTLYRKSVTDDGGSVIADNLDGAYEVVLRAGQWEEVQKLPYPEWKDAIARLVEANKQVDPAQLRSEIDEQTMDFNNNRDAGDRQQARDEGRA